MLCSSIIRLAQHDVTSIPLGGKEQAVQAGTVPQLVALLDDANDEVRAQSAAAIMA